MADSASEVNRRYQDQTGSYVLPNDAQEHDRLDAQSKAFLALMHGKPFHAPVQKPRRILDVGCGTGAMTTLLADKYPDAEVIGVDISPIPDLHVKPRNLTYLQGDIMDLAKSDDPRFELGSFDYIFHRLLVLGITDWPGYIATVLSLLREGGYAEMQDFDLTLYSKTGQRLVDDWSYYPYFREDCEAVGLEIEIGRKLAAAMKDAGFSDIVEDRYKLPVLPDPDMPEAKLIAESNGKAMGPAHRALIKRICGPRRTPEEVESLYEDAEGRFANAKLGDHLMIHVVVGQKTNSAVPLKEPTAA